MPDNQWVRSTIVAYYEVENTVCVYTQIIYVKDLYTFLGQGTGIKTHTSHFSMVEICSLSS